MLERTGVCGRVRWRLKNGLKLGCHDAQSLVTDEDIVEVVALLLFVKRIAIKPHVYTVDSPEKKHLILTCMITYIIETETQLLKFLI
jgi:hypothetical protein